MNREDIVRMAREAKLAFDSEEYPEIWQTYMYVGREEIERFAALVASAERERLTDAAMKAAEKAVDVAIALEREACAQVCDSWSLRDSLAVDMADAIRARGQA